MTGGLFCATVASVLSWSRSLPRVPAVGRLLSRYSIMSTLLGRWWCEDLVSSAQGMRAARGTLRAHAWHAGRASLVAFARSRASLARGRRSLVGVARSWASLARASLIGSLASLVGIARILSCTCCRAFLGCGALSVPGLETPKTSLREKL